MTIGKENILTQTEKDFPCRNPLHTQETADELR